MRTIGMMVVAAVLGAVGLAGCVTPDTHYSQVELNAIQTREYDYAFDDTFNAAINALFDAGYAVTASDKRAGFLRAGRSGGLNGGGGMIQVKIDQAGPRRTAVRISTAEGGQSHVDKTRIDEVQGLINRRLTGSDAPLTTPAPKKGS